MKICSRCRSPKSPRNFHKNKQAADGRHSTCKACRKSYNHTYFASHRHEQAARNASFYSTHRERKTASFHYYCAHNSTSPQFKSYREMTFYFVWDTAAGTPEAARTFARNAETWMMTNCRCPGKDWALHVDKTALFPKGFFGPGGIRWMKKLDVHQKIELAQALRIVEDAGYVVSLH